MSEVDKYLDELEKSPAHAESAVNTNSSNPDYNVDDYLASQPAPDRGFTGALVDGAKSTGRAISSTYNTYTGDGQAVVDNSKEQELASEDKNQDIKNFQSDFAANTGAGTDDEVGLWGAIKGTGKAIIDNPRGAALSVVEQFPNSVPTLAAGWAGAKGGAMAGGAVGSAFGGVGAGPGALIGGAAGFVGGMFLGNTLTETGHKAQEYAADGEFTPDEQSAAMTEGAKKAGAITAVDAITFGIGGKISSTMRRTAENAVEAATRKTLIDAGVDISDATAVSAARSSQHVAKSVSEAQQNAAKIADSLRKRAAEVGVLLTVETIGEGLGEYLGELAATGQASVSEAVLESFLSLGQSSVQSMFNFAKAREKSLTEQEWIDASNGIAPEGMTQEEMPAADGMWDEPTPEAKIDMGQMQEGGVTPIPVFNPQDIDRNLSPAPSQQMGINPNDGPLSAAAAQSVDSGLFSDGYGPQVGINQVALERQGVTPPPVLNAKQLDRGLGVIPRSTAFDDEAPNATINTNILERQGVTPPPILNTDRIDASLGSVHPQSEQQTATVPAQQRTPEQDAQSIWDSLNAFERNAAATDVLGMRGVPAKNAATRKWDALGTEQKAKLIGGLAANRGQRWTDPNRSAQSNTGPVLQNRDRTSGKALEQMRDISNKPDYMRLGYSRDFGNGAPVIEEGLELPASQLGKQEQMATSQGRRMPVQYAVIESDQLLPSNQSDGTVNTTYATGEEGKSRAIAGNGRVAGLQAAWRKGNADTYKTDMIEDAGAHGIDGAVIQNMKQPVLVRVMPRSEITQNIGDESNRSGQLDLNKLEQAKTDMRRLNLLDLKYGANGQITPETVMQFIQSMPSNENLMIDGEISSEATDRLETAVFHKAYDNDKLTVMQSQKDDESKSIIAALLQAAPHMIKLENAGIYDIRPLIIEAAMSAINARRRGIRLSEYVKQAEMGISPEAYPIMEMMLNDKGTIRGGKYIGEQFINMVDIAFNEADKPSTDMYGDVPKRTQEQTIKDSLTEVEGYGQLDAAGSAEVVGQQGRPESATQVDEGQPRRSQRPADSRQAESVKQEAEPAQQLEKWRSNYLQAAKIARDLGIDPKQHKKLVDLVAAIDAANNDTDIVQFEQSQPQQQTPSLDLTQQTEESRAEAEAEDKARIDAEKKAKDKQDREDKKAREKAADAQAVESSLDRFELGQSVDEQLSGQVDMLAGNQETKSVNKNEPVKLKQTVEDFGEKMAGAIKDQPINSLSKNLTDEEMASQPLSALWPVNEPLSIEDNYAAAFSYAARQNIPAKPRLKYKVKRWVDAVKSMREIAKAVQDGEITKDNIGALSKTNDTASSVAAKANLLSGLDRKHWSRIGRVDVSDNAYIFDDNRNKVPSPHTVIVVDGRSVLVKGKYDNDSVTAVIKASLEMAEQSDASKRGQFEIRENRNTGEIFINRKGDKEYRKLKTFPKGAIKEAREFVNNNTDKLVAEWEAIKERDNVTKADVRSDTNKERTGIDYRNGKDVTSEEFGETFGFRGVEFGNWVSQGKGQKDRQGMLNAAYDALLDLAAVAGIPPKAISLNGSLGIAFGSRGKGKYSAHYETNNIVINLTKTKGAGSLAHEWFHALDNYFSRRRGVTPFDGNQTAYNKANYITYKPEPMMALKTSLNKKGLRPHLITKAEYDRRAKSGVNFDADNWTPDTNHPIGVRPTVEKAFAELVSELDKSPMLKRSEIIDKGKVDGYWSSIIERAARSFESYVIQRLEDQGISNQYLANVVTLENFKRDEGRYPYLTNEELKPVAEKFDTLFSTIETREEKDGNFLMFSRNNNQPNNPTTNASLLKNINDSYPALTDSVVTMLQRGRKGQKGGLVIVDSNNGADIAKAYSEATGMPIAQANRLFSDGESINGFYDTKSGITFLVGPNLDAATAPAVLLHEVTHSQQRREIDARSMKLINGRAKEKNADLKTFLETVSQRMIDAGEYGNPLESTTYIVEQAIIEGRSQGYTLADSKFLNAIEKTLGSTVASIVRDFTKMVRQFALRRGLPINITLDDLVQYAMASVEQAAKGNIATENKGGMAYSFAGEDALTADLASLAEAKKQIATDLTPDQVRKNTGWMQGAEGRWRFEIDDSKASFVDAPMLDSYLSNTLTGDKKLSAADQKTLNLLKLKERKMSAELFGAKDKKTDAWDHLFYDWHLVKQQIQELDRRAGGDFMNIGSLLKHDQLFNAYPEMKNIKIRLAVDDSVTMNGFYDRKDNLIEMTAPNKEKLMAGLLHELQHAIQSIEGFARGGSPSQFDYKDATSEYLGRVSNKIIDLLNSNKEFGATVRKVKQEFTKLSNKYPQTTEDGHESVNWDKVPTDESEAYFKLLDQTEKHPEVERWHDLETEYRIARRDGKTLTPFEQYQSLAGEVEARNVESRRHFTEEERREFSPIASEDFQRQDQAIRYSRNAKTRVEGEQQFVQTEKSYGGRVAYDQAKSDGKTKLNYQQWVQVRTPAFIEWFGDWQNGQQTEKQKGSRDPRPNNEPAGRPEQTATAAGTGEAGGRQDHGRGTRIPDILIEQSTGEPKVFYHGTRDSFEAFDLDHPNRKDAGWLGRGAYAASDARMANTYAKLKSGDGSPNVMPLFIRSTGNVYQVDPLEKQKLSQAGQDNIDAVTRRMMNNGFDGAYVEHSDSVEIATFSPNNVKSASGNAGTFSAATDDIRFSRTANPASVHAAPSGMAAWDSPSASKFDDIVYKFQDKHVDTKRVIEAIRDTGKAISDDLDVYLQETLFHGRAAKRTQDFLNMEVNPLIEYMQSAKVDMSDLEEFLHARHAQEANALIAKRDPNMPDGGSGMTNAEAAKYLNSLNGVRRKQFENAAKMVDKIIGGTRETIVGYGLESQETVDGWTSGFKHYIPLQREDKDGQMGIGQGFSVKGKETKGRTGSTRKVVDILANVMMQRERAIVRGEKNRVAVALLGLAKDNPLPEFYTVDVVPTSRVIDKATGLVRNQVDSMYKSRDNAIVAKVNGQEHAILMNEDDPRAMRMVEALKNLDAAQLEGLLGATATATRYFAAVNTQYNPIFGVTNFVRDIQEAMLHLESTPLKGKQKEVFKTTFLAVPAVWRAERASRRGESSKDELGILWDDFQNVGGQTGFRDQFSSSADRGREIQKALTPDGWAETGLGKFFTANGALKAPLEVVRKKAAWMFDLLSDYNTAMENGVRLAVYKAGIDAGLSKQQSAATAKGITVNFNRKGQVTQQLGALYAFFNASVQGSARLGQSLFDMEPGKPKTMRLSSLGKKIVSGGVLLGASQAVLLAMMGFDDDEPPEFIRERNIIIPTGGKTYISIPMPLGYHVIANLGRIPTEFALGGGEDSAKHLISLLDVMSDVYNPLGSSGLSMQTIAPTVLDPLAALAENKDFSGRAIAKESFNRQTPGHALARDTASLPATWLAQVINYATGGTEFTRGEFSPTPDQIDYLVGQLTGGVGREATKFLKSGQATASGDDLPWHNIPLVGRFYGDANSDGAKQSAFYNNMDSVRKHAEEVKGLRAAGRSGEAVEYANKHPHAKLHLAARAAEKQVKGMRDRKRELEQAGAPREEIRALEKRMIQRMEQFVELSAVRK